MILKSKLAPTPVLDEARVRALQSEITDFIDAKALDIQRGRNGETPCEGVPLPVIVNILRGRIECECRAFLHIKQSEGA